MEDNKIIKWWSELPSPTQYMYWIIAFCAMLATGTALILGAIELGLAQTYIMVILLGIGAFVMFFMFIVLWLTIIWPHFSKK